MTVLAAQLLQAGPTSHSLEKESEMFTRLIIIDHSLFLKVELVCGYGFSNWLTNSLYNSI